VEIWVDGSGVLLRGQIARIAVVYADGRYLVDEVGDRTNNQAEYLALIKALKSEQALGAVIHTDSQLLVGHLTKNWKVNAPKLKELWKEASDLLQKTGAKLDWIPREKNRAGKLLEA